MYETASFGQWLKQHRKGLDLTQEYLARRIGCSYIAIHKIEAGARRPSRQVAELLADLFKVPAEEREAFIDFARGLDDRAKSSERIAGYGPPSNLPAQLTRLIGRRELVADMRSWLLDNSARLLTLTGPPGIGKTSIALQVGHEVEDLLRDGVYFVALSHVNKPNLVVPTIAQALDVTEKGAESLLVSLQRSLGDKQTLLVLDNFEQVLDASPVVLQLLGPCPHLKVLITSREALHIPGEQQLQVPALETVDPSMLPPLQTLQEIPAVSLFVERARAVVPDFGLTEQNGQAVAAICARLQGLPLAIELAAARVNLLSPQEMQSRLNNSLSLLESAARHLPPRQRTLRGAIDWSYALLSEGEQRLFARLGVFVGGFTISTAEAVCNALGDLPFDALDAVGSLLDKSLLKREEVLGESRYTMLELIREYALEQLEQRGEADSIRRLHTEYYLALAEAAEVALRGPEQPTWLRRLDTEHDNIGASLRWAREKGGGTSAEAREALDIGLRIGGAIRRFWLLSSYYSEGREELEGLLALSPPQATLSPQSRAAKAKALAGAGRLAYRQGDYPSARLLLEESLALRRDVGDKSGIAWSLADLAAVVTAQGEYSAARSLEEEGLTLQRELGDKQGIEYSLEHLGIVACMEGDYSRARPLFEESLALCKELGHKTSIGILLYELGIVAYMEREYSRARPLFEESLALQTELGYKVGIALSLAGLGEVTADTGQPRRGVWLMGASAGLYESIGGVMEASDRKAYDRALASARMQLGGEDFEKAWQEGRATSVEQAVAYAQEGTALPGSG